MIRRGISSSRAVFQPFLTVQDFYVATPLFVTLRDHSLVQIFGYNLLVNLRSLCVMYIDLGGPLVAGMMNQMIYIFYHDRGDFLEIFPENGICKKN